MARQVERNLVVLTISQSKLPFISCPSVPPNQVKPEQNLHSQLWLFQQCLDPHSLRLHLILYCTLSNRNKPVSSTPVPVVTSFTEEHLYKRNTD